MNNKQTLKQAGYTYVRSLGNKYHLLSDGNNNGHLEVWTCNKNHASFGLIWNNTHLEFVSSYDTYKKQTYNKIQQARENYALAMERIHNTD